MFGSSSSYTVGATGGETTHTLTVDEMPNHVHPLACNWASGGGSSSTEGEVWAVDMSSGNGDGVGKWPYGSDEGATKFGYVGGDKAHNNMPPYIVVNIWERKS